MSTDKARDLAEQIESSVNALATETDGVRKSDFFKQWLDAMATFTSYSFNNQMLIAFQRPTATKVAGFHAWRTLGRHVNKGAKGIAILAPCVYREKTEPENEDSSSTVKKLVGFKTAYVFDLADTTGDPLPTLTYAAADGGDELLARLEWVTEQELGICLDYEEILEHGVDGYSSGGRIVVRTSLSPTAKAGVLLHEISHEQLHWGPNRDEAKAKSRRQRELEAEATAYVVMRYFGIDHVASNYLATYNIDGEQLKQSLQTISATAKFLIATIDPQLNQNQGAAADVASDPPA